MKRINTVNMGPDNTFQDANPGTGQQATSLNAAWFTGVQEELVGIIEFDGQTPADDNLHQLLHAFVNIAHPVGSYYLTEDEAHPPATLWDWTTWTEVTGHFLVGKTGASPFQHVADTGGANSVTLAADQIPEMEVAGIGRSGATGVDNNGAGTVITTNAGNGDTSAITVGTDSGDQAVVPTLPPYRVVRMWRRTA
jgi:hypothetical protein